MVDLDEPFLQNVLELLPVGVITVGACDHRIQELNSRALRMIGTCRDEVVGRVCHGVICPAEAGRCPITDLGQTVDLSERVLLGADGHRVPVLKSAFAIPKNGEMLLIESFVDIRSLKEAEQQITRAREAAEAANRAKSAFLANMSHELRTPLTAILGYCEMLQEQAAELGATDFLSDLQKVHDAGRQLFAVIGDVLDISRIEAGKMDIAVEPVEISCMIADAVSTMEPAARKNGNRLLVRSGDGLGVMQADAVRFRQSLLNLLANACKFTRDGLVTLEVSRSNGGGERWIEWRVEDTGIGIAPEKLERLFQPFSQGDSSTTRRYGGTGLGLAISQRLCQAMGGDITASSEPGKGSTFTIRMPAGS
jgi:PAS domain S-box-containing protein